MSLAPQRKARCADKSPTQPCIPTGQLAVCLVEHSVNCPVRHAKGTSNYFWRQTSKKLSDASCNTRCYETKKPRKISRKRRLSARTLGRASHVVKGTTNMKTPTGGNQPCCKTKGGGTRGGGERNGNEWKANLRHRIRVWVDRGGTVAENMHAVGFFLPRIPIIFGEFKTLK